MVFLFSQLARSDWGTRARSGAVGGGGLWLLAGRFPFCYYDYLSRMEVARFPLSLIFPSAEEGGCGHKAG